MLKKELAKGRADDRSMRCFFITIFNKLLFPTSAFNISNTDIEYTMHFDSFADIDWQQAILDGVCATAINCKYQKQNRTTLSWTHVLHFFW